MEIVEISRRGDLSVSQHLAEMRAWMNYEGVRSTDLRAVRILAGRISFRATFNSGVDAERFRQRFADPVVP
jgi:hypothetical protein